MKPKFKKRKGENLSETRRQGPRGPTVPVNSFLSIERWTRQRAATDRETDRPTDRQQRGKKGELGERQVKKETNKELDRQRDHPPGTGRQVRGSQQRHWCSVSQAGYMRRALSVCLCQSGSLGLFAHWVRIYPFSWECVFSSGLSTPCPLPFSLPSRAPSLSLLLSQVISLTCPSLALSERFRHFLWALGVSHRNQANPPGMDRMGKGSSLAGDSSQACRRERTA